VPASLDAAVRRALAKRPAERFPSAAAFAAALAAPAAPADARPRGRVVSARGALYAAVATLVVGLAGGGVLARWPLAGWPLAGRWAGDPSELARPAVDAPAPAPARRRTWATCRSSCSTAPGDRQRGIAATRPWTPRFSPDGRRVAYGAFGAGRSTSDLWVTDLGAGTTRRLTDDDADANDPQWSPDGATLAYSADAPGGKDLLKRARPAAARRACSRRATGTQFASDWLRDGSALLVTEQAGDNRYDVLVQPADGSAARPYAATPADETAARASPDGRWVAYTSDESGRAEVYLDAYPRPARRVRVSSGGGVHPVWRGDGRELYYWRGDALVAVRLGAARAARRRRSARRPSSSGRRTTAARTRCTTCRPTGRGS
jgi:dipeptidyl aminopeptidase/acylaminoacyl peptidase